MIRKGLKILSLFLQLVDFKHMIITVLKQKDVSERDNYEWGRGGKGGGYNIPWKWGSIRGGGGGGGPLFVVLFNIVK